MVTISKMYNSMEKYEKDNYYLKDKNDKIEFHGKLADDLKLSVLDDKTYQGLINGKNAYGKRIITLAGNGEHDPGRDLTLSPDKSIGVTYYLSKNPGDAEKIMTAHKHVSRSP